MEPQENIYCYDNRDKKEREPRKKNCLGIVATILLVSFAVVIGLIIGAALSGAVLLALPAVIVLAVVLGLLFILVLILLFCNRKKDKKEYCKCCCK